MNRIGVSRSGDGIIAHYKSCRETTVVTEVALKDLMNTRSDLSDDLVLWKVYAEPGKRLEEVTVGVAPDGLATVVEMTGLPPEALLNVQFRTSSLPQGESLTFMAASLRTDRLLVGQSYLTKEEFRATSACD